jgi:hypothetical protein
MKAALGVLVAVHLLATPALASVSNGTTHARQDTILAQASPSPPPTESPTASPSPGAAEDRGGISTGFGLVVAAVLIGGLLVMRNRLLRR